MAVFPIFGDFPLFWRFCGVSLRGAQNGGFWGPRGGPRAAPGRPPRGAKKGEISPGEKKAIFGDFRGGPFFGFFGISEGVVRSLTSKWGPKRGQKRGQKSAEFVPDGRVIKYPPKCTPPRPGAAPRGGPRGPPRTPPPEIPPKYKNPEISVLGGFSPRNSKIGKDRFWGVFDPSYTPSIISPPVGYVAMSHGVDRCQPPP